MTVYRLRFSCETKNDDQLLSRSGSTRFQHSVAFLVSSCASAVAAMGFVRKPVEKREVEIIRRLKHVVPNNVAEWMSE